MVDLVIKNGTVVSGGREEQRDIGVTGGRIEALYPAGKAPGAAEVIDASGYYVLPGFVDAHVHTRAPARPDRETWQSATKAAAASGVTTILEMPTSSPPASTPEAVRNRRRTGEEACYVDFALYAGGAVDGDTAKGLADEGVIGFKVFSHSIPSGREAEFVGLCAPDNAELFSSLSGIAPTGLPCAVHSEDNLLLEQGIEKMRRSGRNDILAHADSRPTYVEAAAIASLLVFAEELSARIHLPHVSSSWGVKLATQAKERGVDVSVETCPHYLVFDREDMERAGVYAKINPPLRSSGEQHSLWQAVHERGIEIIASDHSPYLPEEKRAGDVWSAPAGHPELDAAFPAILSKVADGLLSYSHAAELLATNPARTFGLTHKGSIDPGKDADLVLLDPSIEWAFRKNEGFVLTRDNYRLYDGFPMKGRIVQTLCRGRTVYADGKIIGHEGYGRFTAPA